jgi:hypothetical protein
LRVVPCALKQQRACGQGQTCAIPWELSRYRRDFGRFGR